MRSEPLCPLLGDCCLDQFLQAFEFVRGVEHKIPTIGLDEGCEDSRIAQSRQFHRLFEETSLPFVESHLMLASVPSATEPMLFFEF